MIEQRDICLVPFPFSDQSGRKVRPVVIVSNDEFNHSSEDVIVVGVTSNTSKGRYSLSLSNKDLDEGKLYTECRIKVDNLLKIDKGLIIKRIGSINKSKLEGVLNILMSMLR